MKPRNGKGKGVRDKGMGRKDIRKESLSFYLPVQRRVSQIVYTK